MRCGLSCLLTILLVMAVVGCQKTHDPMADFKKKYPTYPAWGWWEQSAQPTEPPADDEPADPQPPLADSDPAPATPPGDLMSDLERHRSAVWPKVDELRRLTARRDRGEISYADMQASLENARAMLWDWYQPLKVPPPDPNDPEWITVMVWDFMPQEDFLRASDAWASIADSQGASFPNPATRRAVLQFVQRMTATSRPDAGTTENTPSRKD
jgi:hypothetical protein